MSAFVSSLLALRLDALFHRISSWWSHADAHDFGMMAIGIVVGVWFLTKYYAD